MASHQSLEGACSCGRNHYLILVPSDSSTKAELVFDDSADNRRAHSTPLPAFLRVPLTWLQSTTYALYPHESHGEIRRVFSPRHAPHTKRHFCGFCGTPLSYWNEESPEDAERVCVSLGSLEAESLVVLSDAGIFSSNEDAQDDATRIRAAAMAANNIGRDVVGQPWFEEIIEGSALGKMRRSRGGETSADGRMRVEWEVVEFDGDDSGELAGGATKRKLVEALGADDLQMRGAHP